MEDITYAITASPNYAQDKLLFAGRASGLYRSEDGGGAWQRVDFSLSLLDTLPVTTVIFSPSFAADQTLFVGVPGGVLRSEDKGQTWQVVALPTPPPMVSALAISPNFIGDGVVLVGTLEAGVYRSTDRGSHWSAWNFGLLDLNVICIVSSPNFATDETVYVGTESGIFRSTNGGRAWREVNLPVGFEPVLSLTLSPNYAADGVLFAGTDSHGLLYSADRGINWTRLGQDAIPDTVNSIILSPAFPTRPYILVAIGQTLLVSWDGGQSWSNWKAGLIFEQGIASVVAPQGLEPSAPLQVGLVAGGIVHQDR